MIPMQLVGLHLEPSSHGLFLLLREAAEPARALTIFIGAVEAEAIIRGAQGVEMPRPMTHDLLAAVILALGGTVERLTIVELSEGAFHAELQLRGPTGLVEVSTRPSDGVALAVRVGAPIYASEKVLEQAGLTMPQPGAAGGDLTRDIDEAVEDFRAYLETVDPADFVGHEQPEGPSPPEPPTLFDPAPGEPDR